MKKIFLIFVVFSLFVFAGCGGSSKKTNNTDSGETVTDEDGDTADEEPADDTEPAGDTTPDSGDSTDSGDSGDPADSGDSADDSDEPGPEIECQDSRSCVYVKNSTGKCIGISEEEYRCECENGFFWKAGEKACLSKNECSADNPDECLDSKTGLVWSKKSPKTLSTAKERATYCKSLNGESDAGWEVPTIEELRTLVSDCSKTATGGKCKVNDSCEGSSYACKTDNCSCEKTEGAVFSKLGDTTQLASQTCKDDNCWGIDFGSGNIKSIEKKAADLRCVKCANKGETWNGSMCALQVTPGRLCTNIDVCIDDLEDKVIPCPAPGEKFYGQDAQYAAAGFCTPRKFVLENVSEQETIVDLKTGLEWQRKFNKNEAYTWDEAMEYCDNLNFGGHSDWRLPAPHEFWTLPLDTMSQENILGYENLSSWTSQEDGSNYALEFNIGWMSIANTPKTYGTGEDESGINAVCVRGREELPEADFVTVEYEANGDQFVFDTTNELTWSFRKQAKIRLWSEALAYCENLTYAGYNDWRLPNLNEFQTIINYKKAYYPLIDFPDVSNDDLNRYESSYSAPSSSSVAYHGYDSDWIVAYRIDLYGGDVEWPYFGRLMPIFCVRSDRCKQGYFWNGTECRENKCKADSCSKVASSTGVCIPTDTAFECECENGFWNGSKCVNPCDTDPCVKAEINPDGDCTAISATVFDCGCHQTADGKTYCWNDGSYKETSTGATLGNICTGQTKCYDDDKEMTECPDKDDDFYGQDAQTAALGKCKAHSFKTETVSDAAVIVDNNTKLQWKAAVSEKLYSWNDAFAYCDKLEYAGYKDWRLPNPQELSTLVDLGNTDPMLDSTYFKEMRHLASNNLWSSKRYVSGNGEAWYLNIADGLIYPASTENVYHALCIRGKEIPNGFFKEEMKGEGESKAKVLVDTRSKLMWHPQFVSKKWKDALAYCENLKYAGFEDWRLPNRNELKSLVDYSAEDPSTAAPFESFLNKSVSSTTVPAYDVYNSGYNNIYSTVFENFSGDQRVSKTATAASLAVRCVRNAE